MKEIDIRNPRSTGRIKTKICNYIKTDDGTELLEFKYQRIRRTILVDDFLNEVMQARKNSYTTEQQIRKRDTKQPELLLSV